MPDGKRYFIDNFAVKGLQIIEDKKYYFDELDGHSYTTNKKALVKTYIISEDGIVQKIQYNPTYYSQRDSRWINTKYGRSTIGKSGCAPTSMAMAFQSILSKEILPTDVADYLYFKIDQFNKKYNGTSGLGIILAAEYFNYANYQYRRIRK